MKTKIKLLSHFLLTISCFSMSFNCVGQSLTPENQARESILDIKDNNNKYVTPLIVRKAMTDITNMVTLRMPFVSMVDFRAGFGDNASAVQIQDGDRSGVFIYDPLDVTSADDSSMVLIRAGKRYIRQYNKGIIDVRWFGAKGGAKTVGNGVANSGSNIITSSTANFTSDLVGKKIMIRGAGAGLKPLVTTITARLSATQVTTLINASNSVTGAEITYGGVDETSNFQKAINFLISKNGGKLIVPTDRYWIEGTIFVNPTRQIPISIEGPNENTYAGGYGDQSTGATLMRSRTGDIIRVNLNAAGNTVMSPGSQYVGFSISGLSFSGKSDSTGMNAIRTFRTRGTYRNLFSARLDYLIVQSNTDASSNLNYCDMNAYENIRISASLFSGMLLSRADASVINGFYFEGPEATCKYGIEIDNSSTVSANGVLHWGGGGLATTISGGSFIKTRGTFGASFTGVHIEDSHFETVFDLGNSGGLSVNGLFSHLASNDMFRVDNIKGLSINDWYSYEAKGVGTYDINFMSSYATNSDITWRSANLYDFTQVAGTTPRVMLINHPENRGVLRTEMPIEAVSDLNSPLGFRVIRSITGAANLPANTTYVNGIQVASNLDNNFQMQLLSDGFSWLKRVKNSGTWATPVYMIDASNINSVVNVTDGPSVSLNAELGYPFEYRWTLGADRTVPAPFNPRNGQRITFRIQQDATGNRLLTWNSAFKFPGVSTPNLSKLGTLVDHLEFKYNSTNSQWDLINFQRGQDIYRRTVTVTASGDGTSTTINTPHGLAYTPTIVSIVANNAASAPFSWINEDGTNFIINFNSAPPSGTNNLSYTITYDR